MALEYSRTLKAVHFTTGPALARLDTNVPPDLQGAFYFYAPTGVKREFAVAWGTGRPYLTMEPHLITTPHKVFFLPFNGPGVWFNDLFIYTEGLTELVLTQGSNNQPTPTHRIAGTCKRHGMPFAGAVQVLSVFEQTHLGSATANPSTGDWVVDIALSGEVFVFVSMPYGVEFTPGAAVAPGDTIHPPTANGFVYQVIQGGALGNIPTEWPTGETLATGTAQLEPVPYLAPEIHGPITPAPIT